MYNYHNIQLMIKKIIIVGSGNSGSGAIFDYLAGQKKNLPFLNGNEFRIIQDPDGLYDLYINNYTNFSINNSASSFERFIKTIKTFASKQKSSSLIIEALESFLKQVISINYSGLPEFYRKKLNLNLKINFYLKRIIFKKKINELKIFNMTVPVNEKKFLEEAELFLNNLIKIIHNDFSNYQNIIFNQSGNFWNINDSTQFFGKRKIIIVDRDPRSIYWSFKRTDAFSYPGNDVDVFIEWYKKTQNIFKKNFKKNKFILKINYENFLINYYRQSKLINKFIDLDINEVSSFDYKKSYQNIYKAKYNLSKKDLKKIEKKLSKYLKW